MTTLQVATLIGVALCVKGMNKEFAIILGLVMLAMCGLIKAFS